MTQAGKEKLEKELTYLKESRRKELEEEIKHARAFCDFSEDVSFREMMDERMTLEERIQSLENKLYNAVLIIPEEKNSPFVTIGSSVTFIELPDGEEETYTIVGVADADPSEHKISSESPIAKSLLGYEVNDDAFIQTPGGDIKVRIVEVQ